MKKNTILACLLAVLLPGLAFAAPKEGKGLKKIDTNKDGVITLAEAESGGATRIVEDFTDIDTDGNGELSREELRTHHQNRMQERRGRAQNADTDGNGSISSDEASKAGMQRLVDNFDKIDANGDGEVTREEMRQAKQGKGKGPGNGQGKGQGNGQGQG